MTSRVQGLRAFEWPTWCLIAVIYGGFGLVSYFHDRIPLWLLPLLGGWFVCWQSQLQHECIHGHPTSRQWLNDLIAAPSLFLWLPYPIYAENHRQHHATEDLTVQDIDPESYYWRAEKWQRAGAFRQLLARLNQSLLGRMLLGPFLSVAGLIGSETRMLLSGDVSHLRFWLVHLLAIAPLIYWIVAICGMTILEYLLFFAFPGTALALVRSFCEHVPAESRRHRTRSVEGTGPLAWLFLFNNLHVLHHQRPALPWYALPSIYYAERQELIGDSGNAPIKNYAEVFRRYFLRIKDSPVSPLS